MLLRDLRVLSILVIYKNNIYRERGELKRYKACLNDLSPRYCVGFWRLGPENDPYWSLQVLNHMSV